MVTLRDDDVIWWAGWETTWTRLRTAGWFITIKPKYENWRQPECSAASKEKIYIRHGKSKQLGRITDNAQFRGQKHYELDFMIQECNHRVKPQKIIEEADLTVDDIPKLMQLILELQPKSKRKKSDKLEKQADILLLKTA